MGFTFQKVNISPVRGDTFKTNQVILLPYRQWSIIRNIWIRNICSFTKLHFRQVQSVQPLQLSGTAPFAFSFLFKYEKCKMVLFTLLTASV